MAVVKLVVISAFIALSNAQCKDYPTACKLPSPPKDPGLRSQVCMQGGTEDPTNRCVPFNTPKVGNFTCSCCGHALFSSADIYDSGTGWPAFHKSLGEDYVCNSNTGTEVRCANCGAHLGDFFAPSHYCIDGICMNPPKTQKVWGSGCEHESSETPAVKEN
eukprot:m.100881 g.100881  ORF g.100881 m.100881 type:complete len:161 (+) comp13728_c0_seq2:127-609(+)